MIRHPLRVRELGLEPFVLALPHHCEVLALRPGGGVFVVVDRDPQLSTDPLSEGVGQGHTLLDRDVPNRHEGADIGGPDAGMLALVGGHVDQFGGPGNAGKGPLQDRLWRTHQGDDRAVGGPSGIHIEQGHTLDRSDGVGDGLDDRRVAAFGEVGHTLDEGVHGTSGRRGRLTGATQSPSRGRVTEDVRPSSQ